MRSWRGWVPRPVRDGLAGGLTLMNAILLFDLVFPFQSPMGGLQARVTHRIKSFLSGSIVKQKGKMEGVASLSPSSSICKGEGDTRLRSHRPVTLGLRTPGPQHGWPPYPCPPSAPLAVPTAHQGCGGAAQAGEEGPPYPHSEDGRLPAHPLPTQSLSYIKKKVSPP